MLAQIVVILALLLILVGLIMVLLDAFSESIFWGLLILFIPILGPVYCFIKWNKDQARNGFAMSLVGVVMALAGIYGGGAKDLPIIGEQEIVQNLPSALPEDAPLPNEEEAAKIVIEGEEESEYDPILSTDKDKFSPSDLNPLAPKEDETVNSPTRSKTYKRALDLANLDSSINQDIEVVFLDGTTKKGKLISVSDYSLSLEEQVSGGMISFEHNFENIQSTFLLVDPSKPPPPPVVEKETVDESINQELDAIEQDSIALPSQDDSSRSPVDTSQALENIDTTIDIKE